MLSGRSYPISHPEQSLYRLSPSEHRTTLSQQNVFNIRRRHNLIYIVHCGRLFELFAIVECYEEQVDLWYRDRYPRS